MKTIHRNIVSALIFSKDDLLFIGMKDPKKGGVYSDCWHIPGGGIDVGETKTEALKREILEETGINFNTNDVELIDSIGEGESVKKINNEEVLCKMKFFVYKIQLNEIANKVEIKLNDDLVKYEWVDLKKLNDYQLTPPSIRLFTKLGICNE